MWGLRRLLPSLANVICIVCVLVPLFCYLLNQNDYCGLINKLSCVVVLYSLLAVFVCTTAVYMISDSKSKLCMHAFSMIQLIVTPVTQHQRKAARIPLRTLHFVVSSPSLFKELIKNTKTHCGKI